MSVLKPLRPVSITDELKSIIGEIRKLAPGMNERFQRDVRSLGDGRQLLQHMSDLFSFADVKPASLRLLDAGTGVGFALLISVILGVSEARGLEVQAANTEAIAKWLTVVPEEVAKRIHADNGDVARMPYGDAEFDFVTSDEAMSHYPDADAFLVEAARVLRPGGVLVISDCNNGASPRQQRRNVEIWEAQECGPAGRQYLSPHGPAEVDVPFVELRRQLIAERFPDLSEEDRQVLAEGTSGLSGSDIDRAVENFKNSGTLPSRKYRRGECAIRPDSGIAEERLVVPSELTARLQSLGFSVTVRGYWGGANGRVSYRLADNVLALGGRLTVPYAPALRIIARRK